MYGDIQSLRPSLLHSVLQFDQYAVPHHWTLLWYFTTIPSPSLQALTILHFTKMAVTVVAIAEEPIMKRYIF